MTEKRYFKREWGEESYFFDSETIKEEEFDDRVQYEDYRAFENSMLCSEVVDRLNALHEENQELKQSDTITDLEMQIMYLKDENEQLKQSNNELRVQLNLTADQRNEFHRGARENANIVGKLEKENEGLKQQLTDWETSYDLLKEEKRQILEVIDDKLKELETDYEKSVKAGMPTGAIYGEIELLEYLKKEVFE